MRQTQFPLNHLEQGGGQVASGDDGFGLSIVPQQSEEAGGRHMARSFSGYQNAQLDDYGTGARKTLQEVAPVTLSLVARFCWENCELPVGTAGFGFWNIPYGGGGRLPVLPTAIWFFYGGPESNMDFSVDVPGNGWKAAVIHAHHPLAYALLPLGLPGMLLMHSRALYRLLWPMAERLFNISEKALPVEFMTEAHAYTIQWQEDDVKFRIDNEVVHHVSMRCTSKLGFVAWIDNQYLVATPRGRLKWGTSPVLGRQTMQIRNLQLHRGA